MQLTILINLAERTVRLKEAHGFATGDTYDPLVIDFTGLTASQLEGLTASIVLKLYAKETSTAPFATATGFSKVAGHARLRQSVLRLDGSSALALFDVAAAEAGAVTEDEKKDFRRDTQAWLEISDSSTTYAACQVPLALRYFVPDDSGAVYYTREEVDGLLKAFQEKISAVVPLRLDRATDELTVDVATAAAPGVVSPGKYMSVDEAGSISLTTSGDDSLVTSGVLAAGLEGKVDTEDGKGLSSNDFTTAMKDKLAAIEAGAQRNVKPDWDKPGADPAGILHKPSIPDFSELTFTVDSASVGGTPSVDVFGAAPDFHMRFVLPKGGPGPAGPAGPVWIAKTYDTAAAMNEGHAADVGVVTDGSYVLVKDTGGVYEMTPAAYMPTGIVLMGPPGDEGARGSLWYSGTAVTGGPTYSGPVESAVPARVGDMYLNVATGDVYQCTSVDGVTTIPTWTYKGNVKGAKGDRGDPLTYGDLTPVQKDELKGAKGDPLTYGDLTPAQKDELKGAKGDPFTYDDFSPEQLKGLTGPRGPMWFCGEDFSQVVAPDPEGVHKVIAGSVPGDFYLDTVNNYVYRSSDAPAEDVWVPQCRVKGDQGHPGKPGEPGEKGDRGGIVVYFGACITGTGEQTVSSADFITDVANQGYRRPVIDDVFVNSDTGEVYRCTVGGSPSTWQYRFKVALAAGV